MLRVNGLYGHIRRNDGKAALLVGLFLLLFMALQTSVRLAVYAVVASAELRSGKLVPITPEYDPFLGPLRDTGFSHTSSSHTANGVRTAKGPGSFSATATPGTLANPLASGGEKPPAAAAPAADASKAGPPPPKPTFLQVLVRAWERSRLTDMFGLVLLAAAACHLVQATWWNSLYIRYALKAKPLERRENPALFALVENLCITAGIPCPAIEVIDSPSLNAYASGLTPASARLGLTTGLISRLDRDELEAVIAHELTHIVYRDMRLMAVTKACVDLVLPFLRKGLPEFRRRLIPAALAMAFAVFMGVIPPVLIVIMVGLLLSITVMTFVVKAMILHSREFVADAGAIELTKNPAALISALRRIAGVEAEPIGSGFATQAMMFAGADSGLFSTHPSLEDRIAAISLHGAVSASDTAAYRSRIVAPLAPAPSSPDAAAAFGRRVHGLGGGTAAAGIAARRGEAFPVAAQPRAVWGTDGAFTPSREPHGGAARSAGDQRGLVERLFQDWIISGRIDRLQEGARKRVRKGGRVWFYVQGALVVFLLLPTILLLRSKPGSDSGVVKRAAAQTERSGRTAQTRQLADKPAPPRRTSQPRPADTRN